MLSGGQALGAGLSRLCRSRGVGLEGQHRRQHEPQAGFDRIQPGQLGIAVHGFRWQNPAQPPRNAKGSTYGPRVPLEDFMRAQFSEFALFEVEGPAYESTTKVWSDREPDAWNLRVPLNVYAHEKNVELRMDEINPAVAEAIRKSGIFASMPWVIAPATLEIPGSIGAARRLTTDGSTDVLGHAVKPPRGQSHAEGIAQRAYDRSMRVLRARMRRGGSRSHAPQEPVPLRRA